MLVRCSVGHARSLAGLLDDVVTRNDLARLTPSVAFVPELTRVAIRSADYPTTSTTPNFVYSFDPVSGGFERSERALGSIFNDQPETVGRGTFEVGLSAFLSDASRWDGDEVTGAGSPFFVVTSVPTSPVPETIPVVLRFDDFRLQTLGFSLTATYGLTADWDVNVVGSLLQTNLYVQGGQDALLEGSTLRVEPVDIDETRLGLGDLLLRTKYRLGWFLAAELAAALTLRVPTGYEDNFQGLGDWIVIPSLVGGRDVGPHNFHVNLGVEANASAVERTRVRYGVGASLRVLERLSVLVDVFGSSGLVDEDFLAGTFTLADGTEEGLHTTAPRTDLVDAAVGMKVKLYGSAIGFASAIVPLTTDGLRADVIPMGGVQVTF